MGEMGFAQPLKRLVKGDNNREEKILALLLAVTVTVSAVSAVLPGLSAASSPNLFENGDFTNVSGNAPTGWKVGTAAAFDIAVGAEKTPDGQKAITLTYKGNNGSTVTLGGFVFAAQQMETDSYAPTSNNVALGGFEPTNLSLKNGNTAAVYRCSGKRQPLFRLVQGQTASFIQAKTNNKWVCSGFEVTPDDTGNIYLQLSCSAGTLDVECVMLFESTYALRYNANDYTV